MRQHSRALVGAGAGVAATVPQSVIVWGLRWAGVYGSPPAPEQVSERISRPVLNLRALPAPARISVKLVQHVGFGALCGAGYGLATTKLPPTAITGVLTGLGVWAVNYAGWLPAAHIMPPPHNDETGRQGTLLLAHMVYGLALGLLMKRWTPR
jgi:hypothetical protein